MYHGPLVSGFVNISVYFNKLVNNLNHLIYFLKKIKIADAICHTLFYERR